LSFFPSTAILITIGLFKQGFFLPFLFQIVNNSGSENSKQKHFVYFNFFSYLCKLNNKKILTLITNSVSTEGNRNAKRKLSEAKTI